MPSPVHMVFQNQQIPWFQTKNLEEQAKKTKNVNVICNQDFSPERIRAPSKGSAQPNSFTRFKCVNHEVRKPRLTETTQIVRSIHIRIGRALEFN